MIKRFPLNEICKKSHRFILSDRCSAYSNFPQGCWASLKFENDKNFNGAAMIFFLFNVTLYLTPNFYFYFYFQPFKLNW